MQGVYRGLAPAPSVYTLPELKPFTSRQFKRYEPPGYGANVSDAEGRIVKPSMPAGVVEFRIEARGFRVERRSVTLERGKPRQIEIRLVTAR